MSDTDTRAWVPCDPGSIGKKSAMIRDKKTQDASTQSAESVNKQTDATAKKASGKKKKQSLRIRHWHAVMS